ncbi:XRE family transcriptional regulator [Streptomyces sp. AD681]|uniref:XRE family transcriptional regulator n=1 Tax=Streptomyces sp. AD681 TaxID=3019069 RepID=UPI0022F1A920|nr:XRE family transcriptional regulator [Streptomyces sp. AD681]MDA5147385.1 XRE family transcriptional regulator [Streptomyces sp. AD681]
MIGASGPAQPPPLPGTARRGRRPAPISPQAGLSHRAWLEPVRAVLFASGLTLDDLVERSGYSKTRISELLRGNGYYPAWEITFSVSHALDVPARPLRRLWTAAAREARKDSDWIRHCIEQVAHEGDSPPLPYRAFTEAMRPDYHDYARAFLLTDQRAHWVVCEAFDILWLCWSEAAASASLNHYAWQLFRSRVMLRTPRHTDGRPDLRAAVFSTHEVRGSGSTPGHFMALTELIDLFDVLTRLPDDQMDLTVLHYLCGIPAARIAHILGMAPALTHAVDHHARATLDALVNAPTPE